MSGLLAPHGLTASALVDMLRNHYIADGRLPGGIFATEIESPDGRRRADALWCPWTIAGGEGFIGHEIKVSRSDLMIELADPTKAEPWARYCRQWYLVVAHPALIDGLTIPDAWGVMAPPSGRRRRSMTIVRHAPLLRPVDVAAGWRRVATWQEYRYQRRLEAAENAAAIAKRQTERAEAELLDRRVAEGGRVDHRAAAVGRILAELDKRLWHSAIGDDTVDQVVAAITDLDEHRRLARRLHGELRWRADEARRIASPAADIAKALDRLAEAGAPTA